MNVVLRRLSTRDFRMSRLLILLLAITAIAAKKSDMLCGVVHLQPHNPAANISGDLTIIQTNAGSPVKIEGTIYGLTKGLHGFHVHEKGDLRQGCTSAGAHYNPNRKTHGGPDDGDDRHVGDLGNIEANDEGIATVDITDSIISLAGPHSILGRSIVVHASEDNLGLGHDEESRTTGRSGARVACGIIGVLQLH